MTRRTTKLEVIEMTTLNLSKKHPLHYCWRMYREIRPPTWTPWTLIETNLKASMRSPKTTMTTKRRLVNRIQTRPPVEGIAPMWID